MKSVSRILSVFFFLLLTLQSVPLLAETDGKIHIFDTPSAYIATDKPVYRNGETLRIHGVFLSSWGNLPCKEPMQHKVIITDACSFACSRFGYKCYSNCNIDSRTDTYICSKISCNFFSTRSFW